MNNEWFYAEYQEFERHVVGPTFARRVAIEGRRNVGKFIALVHEKDLPPLDKPFVRDFLEGRLDRLVFYTKTSNNNGYGVIDITKSTEPPWHDG